MDDYYVWVDLNKDKKYYAVSLIPKKGKAKLSAAGRVAGEFQNELLSNVLRYAIASRNRPIREAVVRSALFFSQPAQEQARIARALASREKNA